MIVAWLLVLVSGCADRGPRWQGTQIGIEHEGADCERVSTEVVDPTAAPEGFERSAEAELTAHLGEFHGFRMDEDEEPTDEPITLVVSSPGGEIVLERYEPPSSEIPDFNCPDRVRQAVDIGIEAPPTVSFAGSVDLVSDVTGWGTIDWEGAPEAFTAIPEPSFDREAAEGVVALIRGGHVEDAPWWVDVAWAREVPSREIPGEVEQEVELVLWGWVGEEAR